MTNAVIAILHRLISEYEVEPSGTKTATDVADFLAYFLVQTGVNSYGVKAGYFGVSNEKPGKKPGNRSNVQRCKPIFHEGFKASFN
jgi:hypothetical protein